jgi:hypothetical protein
MTRWHGPLAAATLSFCLSAAIPAAAQQTPAAHDPGRTRVAWTFIGAGIGFGGGLLAGLAVFDDAVHAERKIVTTSLIGAAAGGLIGARFAPRASPPMAAPGPVTAADPLWNGMLVGAAAGAGIGLWYVPKAHCKPHINPECPGVLRLTVGIPAIAGGAALGALADRLVRPRPASTPAANTPTMSIGPVIGRKAVGVRFVRTF